MATAAPLLRNFSDEGTLLRLKIICFIYFLEAQKIFILSLKVCITNLIETI